MGWFSAPGRSLMTGTTNDSMIHLTNQRLGVKALRIIIRQVKDLGEKNDMH